MITQFTKILGIALIAIVLPISSVYGATFLPTSGEVASLRSETSGDVYTASKSIVITAPVEGDIFAAGENVDISGSSSASIFGVGQNVVITGEVMDDVRVAGETVSVGSTIAHDLFAAGSDVLVTKDSHVHGDVYIGGEHVTISGTIHGNLFVAGNSITVTNGGTVMGNITARGSAPVIEDGATVSGSVKTIASKETKEGTKDAFEFGAFLASLVSTAVFALALLFGAPVLVAKTKEDISATPLRSGLVGLLWLLVCIPVTLLLFASGVGIYLGLFIISVTLPLCFLAFGLMVIAAGSIVYRLVTKKEGVAWQNAVIGAVIVALLALLDFIGFILVSVAFLVALGALLKTLWTIIQGK